MTLSGGGLAEKTQIFKADRESIPFSFNSSALAKGGKAVLTVKLIDGGKEFASVSQTITRLKKNSGSMVWIENGVIMKNGLTIHGLSSAATIWCSAAVGCLCGYGMWREALIAVTVVILINWGLKSIELYIKRLRRSKRNDSDDEDIAR